MRSSFISRLALGSLAAVFCFAPVWAQSPAPVKLALIEGLSGPFGNTGEAVVRNIAWAVERVNARGGVKTPQGKVPMVLIEVQTGTYLGEDDITRYEDVYARGQGAKG